MQSSTSVEGELWWPGVQAGYIRARGERYPDAVGIEPGWTMEVAADPHRTVRDPDPVSRSGAVRIIGFSSSAGFVLTVIMDAADGAGITAWKTSGANPRAYEGDSSHR